MDDVPASSAVVVRRAPGAAPSRGGSVRPVRSTRQSGEVFFGVGVRGASSAGSFEVDLVVGMHSPPYFVECLEHLCNQPADQPHRRRRSTRRTQRRRRSPPPWCARTCFQVGQVTRRISCLQFLEVILRLRRPLTCTFHPAIRFHVDSDCPESALAGAEGFEPPLAVLETAGLPLNLRPCCPARSRTGSLPVLLDFLVRLVLAAVRAELLHFQTLGRGLLVLRVRVVPVLALGALERDDFASHVYS